MSDVPVTAWQQPEIIRHTQRVLDSFRHWTGRELLPRSGTPAEQARALFEAPLVVLSDGTEADPILNYGNAAALSLWEMTWEQFTRTPSLRTAEPARQPGRARALADVTRKGYVSDYTGVRIASTGRRFKIQDATVWIVLDERGTIIGKAATFAAWTYL
ncbi:MAG: MEKHLA domain-containing protein [Planctomycetota bacterium]|nr:MEKHLA domain-containing protein [Planctomycetota bacterium]